MMLIARIFKLYRTRSTSSVLIFFCIDQLSAQSLIPELFRNFLAENGEAMFRRRPDAIFAALQCGWGMDAQVNIPGRSQSAITLSSIDIKGPEEDRGQEQGLTMPGSRDKYGDTARHIRLGMNLRFHLITSEQRIVYARESALYPTISMATIINYTSSRRITKHNPIRLTITLPFLLHPFRVRKGILFLRENVSTVQ